MVHRIGLVGSEKIDFGDRDKLETVQPKPSKNSSANWLEMDRKLASVVKLTPTDGKMAPK